LCVNCSPKFTNYNARSSISLWQSTTCVLNLALTWSLRSKRLFKR
jgi:hypothetical protein